MTGPEEGKTERQDESNPAATEGATPQPSASQQQPESKRPETAADTAHRVATCTLRNGILVCDRQAWAYYTTQQGGPPMLVMPRREGERIRVNESVEIVVLEIRGDEATVGVEVGGEMTTFDVPMPRTPPELETDEAPPAQDAAGGPAGPHGA